MDIQIVFLNLHFTSFSIWKKIQLKTFPNSFELKSLCCQLITIQLFSMNLRAKGVNALIVWVDKDPGTWS